MNRRERLIATLQGRAVDRPAVNFYEIGGFDVDPDDPDEFNIYNSPSWRPLLQLAEDRTDLIRMRSPELIPAPHNPRDEFFSRREYQEDGSKFVRTTLRCGGRKMTSLTRRDRDIDTVWTVEHLLKDLDDLKAFLELPDAVFDYTPNVAGILEAEEKLGDRGIVMIDTPDPLCLAAELLSMGDYTIAAMTEEALFARLIEKFARGLWQRTETVAREAPGRLWRIYGPEYASEPYLPPHLFERYVVGYDRSMVRSIDASGGFARIHCHGRLANILPHILAAGAAALDPIEPPPVGDVSLADVRKQYGRDMVLFGNIEIRDIEAMPPDQFERVAAASLRDGSSGEGRGFVLMPSASPYGREITPTTMANYETMVRLATGII